MRPASPRLWRGIVAVAAIALYSGHSLYLASTLAPWPKRGAGLAIPAQPGSFARTPPIPALAALRKKLSELAGRADVAPADAEDVAAVAAYYNAHSGSLLWVA